LVELASKIEIQLTLTEETIAELSPTYENKKGFGCTPNSKRE
jgi:hypothetical protein